MFAVANEKQRLSVVFLTGHFLQHPFTACFCYYTLPFKVKYTWAHECAVVVVIIPGELSARDETRRKK